jgi:diguanylate cyclase
MGIRSLKGRVDVFALGAGALAFATAFLAVSDPWHDTAGMVRAISFGLLCGLLSWASARRALLGIFGAVDLATARIVEAASGDLTSRTPDQVGASLPQLSGALDGMFAQVRANLDSATTLALYDPVTALPNRTHFRDAAERAMKAVPEGRMSALAFIDLDNFKTVNDTLGHAGGDQALVKVANRLRTIAAGEMVRQADGAAETVVGRYAGDEFAVFFPHIDGREDAARIGALMLAALTKPFEIGDQQVVVGASIGIALSPEHGQSLIMLMRAGDVAMYHAKASGRGQYQFFAECLAERMAKRTQLETELRDAIARREFTIAFQPQVSLSDGRVQAAEGLLRWIHPVDGLRLPGGRRNGRWIRSRRGSRSISARARSRGRISSCGCGGRSNGSGPGYR